MDYIDYLLVKFIALLAIAFVINFLYGFFNAMYPGQEQRDKSTAERKDL